jgi:hypothetical protein
MTTEPASYISHALSPGPSARDLQRQIRAAIRSHPDGAIVLSLFQQPSSVITAAELLAEIGDCRARYPNRDALAADAGHAEPG